MIRQHPIPLQGSYKYNMADFIGVNWSMRGACGFLCVSSDRFSLLSICRRCNYCTTIQLSQLRILRRPQQTATTLIRNDKLVLTSSSQMVHSVQTRKNKKINMSSEHTKYYFGLSLFLLFHIETLHKKKYRQNGLVSVISRTKASIPEIVSLA